MAETEAVQPADQAEDADSMAEEVRQGQPIARFVHEHPGMAIAGGIVLGMLAATLLPRRNREFVAQKSSALADAVSAAGLMLYREALDRAGETGDGIRGIAGRLGQAAIGKAEGPGNAGSEEGKQSAGGFDLAEGLAALIRHLRGRSQS